MQFKSLQVFAQGIAYQCGTIPFRLARHLIRGLQKLLIEDNLDGFHMWTPFHSILHSPAIHFFSR